MKKVLLAFVLPLVLSCQNRLSCTVKRVLDGDTFEIKNKKGKIRLKYIDCPENDQMFGKEARSFTDSVLHSGNIEIVKRGKDKYRRTLAEVFVNGKSLNKMLVENGLAWCYPQYDPAEYLTLQWNARKEGIGLWSSGNYISPREFRKLKK